MESSSSSSSSSSQHLIDSLTSHIALYHSRSPIPNPNPSPRSAVLRWLASLPTPTRQSILTFTNPSFTQLLLKMSSHLAFHGPTLFFLLPDLPSASSASLPSLCHRKSRGLLVRAMPGSSVSSGLLLFGSKDENLLDSVTVSEDLVGDVNGFVKLMDEVSNGRFLRGEEVGLGEEWKEMGWLKDKGYFSLDEFVANRLELVLRRSWGRGKGKGCGVMGESAFWRKKGCVDWWAAIDARQRRVFCLELLGKMVKSLANEIIEGKNIVLKNKFGFLKVEAEWPQKFGPTSCWQRPKMPCLRSNSDVCWDTNLGSGLPHHLVKLLNRLLVIQEISAIILACRLNKVEKETLFFSRVESVRTVSDYIMRKFRGLIMAVSIDYISRELLGDEKLETLPDKPEVKKLNSRKGKKKPRNSKRINSITNSSKVDSASLESTMHNECRFDCQTDSSSKLCHQEKNFPTATNWKTDADNTCILPKDPGKEHAIGLLDCKGPGDRKRNRGKGTKRKNASLKKVVESVIENQKTYIPVISVEDKVEESVELADASTLLPILSDLTRDGTHELCLENGKNENSQSDCSLPFADNCCCSRPDKVEAGIRDWALPSHARDGQNPQMSPCPIFNGDHVSNKQINSFVNYSTVTSVCDNTRLAFPTLETGSTVMENEHMLHYGLINGNTLQSIPPKVVHTAMNEKNEKSTVIQSGGTGPNVHNHANFMGGTSYEWPSTTLHLTSSSSPHFPAATDRLHLDVGHRQPNHFRQSFVTSRHQSRNPPVEAAHGRTVPSLTLPMSYDWPPVVKNCGRLNQTVTISYDTAFNPPLPPSFCSGFAAREMQISGACSENEEFPDDTESYWLSEEESGPQALTGRDYNQFFGGGVMYWNSAEHVGTGFSRPPSHSSEDSSWAWYEADLNRAIDDMIGLASPSAVPYCSPFDPLGPGHQPSASDVPEERPLSLSKLPGCFEGVKADTLPYTMLRPIIVPRISREGSRSEFNVSRDHNSPCFPSRRHNHPHSKRPPSPVVLCIPRVPRPPPPSPVSESRKRGFPIVRSGSSSPRHWGLRNGFHEDGNTEDPRLCMDGAEVVWPSWGTKGLSGTPVAQSIQGSLLQNHLLTISQEHPDVALPLQPPELLNCPHKASLTMLHNLLHEEIEFFCRQVAAENLIKKPYINWAVKRVTRSLQDLWPRSRTNVFGSNATGLALPTSDVDLVVSLPPVRNLEPIKEAGILEGRNGIKETCLQHAARYLANQEWVRNDSLKTIENTAIPIIMLVAEVSQDINYSDGNSSILEVQNAQPTNMPAQGASNSDQSSSEDTSLITCSKTRKDGGTDVKLVRLDISFKSPSHTGLQTSKLVRELTQQFPASVPLALVLKKFLADRSLDHSYSGGLSSYCLVLLITRFLQHEHHICRSINQNLGSLLMDFLYFFGNVFDPRQMRIFIQGSGVYMKRERGLSIDPIHIDDPLFPSNNVGRNCFRIHQCIKAFADAFSVLENELSQFSDDSGPSSTAPFELLRKIIPSIDREE